MKPLLLSIQQEYVWTKARLYGRLWKMTGYILHSRIGNRIGYIQRGTGLEYLDLGLLLLRACDNTLTLGAKAHFQTQPLTNQWSSNSTL